MVQVEVKCVLGKKISCVQQNIWTNDGGKKRRSEGTMLIFWLSK